jgi:hypothetical protein
MNFFSKSISKLFKKYFFTIPASDIDLLSEFKLISGLLFETNESFETVNLSRGSYNTMA